uniref:Sulfotransferase n=1 Tax=Nothobranchius furzeri TaxID=105023 RepID=A0A8C6Q6Q4_NOTFU
DVGQYIGVTLRGWFGPKMQYPGCYEAGVVLKDTGREIDKLCSFLGISPSADVKDKVVSGVQFDNMKKNKMANYSTIPVMDFKISPFMRKGKVGDWKNHFTVAQNQVFDEDHRKKMKDPTLQFRNEI